MFFLWSKLCWLKNNSSQTIFKILPLQQRKYLFQPVLQLQQSNIRKIKIACQTTFSFYLPHYTSLIKPKNALLITSSARLSFDCRSDGFKFNLGCCSYRDVLTLGEVVNYTSNSIYLDHPHSKCIHTLPLPHQSWWHTCTKEDVRMMLRSAVRIYIQSVI